MVLKNFILIALATAAAHALPNAEPEPLDVGDVSPRGDESSGGNVLFARDCDYNGCTSATYSGIKAGKYCGFCKQVLGPKYDPENIYQYVARPTSLVSSEISFEFFSFPILSPGQLEDLKTDRSRNTGSTERVVPRA